MEDQIINLETAILAKEKGFDKKVHDYYSKNSYAKEYTHYIGFNDDYWGDNWFYNWNAGEPVKPFSRDCYSAPTQTTLQTWLRVNHNIDVIISSNLIGYGYILYNRILIKNITNKNVYQTYEESLEAGLQEALKLIE